METRDTVNADNPASLDAAEETQTGNGSADQERRLRQQGGATMTGSDNVATDKPEPKSAARRPEDGRQTPSQEKPSAQALVEPARARDYRERWTSIQAVFVDQPKDAVQKADDLVEEVVHELTDVFGRERSDLEKQWSSGEQVSTEQLRVALQRYRTFFEQLLSA